MRRPQEDAAVSDAIPDAMSQACDAHGGAASSSAVAASPFSLALVASRLAARRSSAEADDAAHIAIATDVAQLLAEDSAYSPKDIADFLHQLPHLDPKTVGRVLGEPDARALEVLQEYANGFVFKGFSFDIALRVYLGRFALPGEAQKIDRILQAFAKAYFSANPNGEICTSEDAVYTLAFSVVLLNTDAHNPRLAKHLKMNKDDFIRNHRRIVDNGHKIPRDYLGRCFDSFSTYPIQLIPRKRPTMRKDELELTFADGPMGIDIETSFDGRTCSIKRYAPPYRHILCSRDGKLPELTGYVVVAVADDCTQQIGYWLTRYLLKTAARPVTIRLCEPSIYYASLSG
ncbi:hypothetical protein P43SY_001057 [Pythium insidiosum]|uniref:SEC7 domain-containing protein n=1 Tax=Pythium insidiosum TaxID=114742 RepID=A0AAD5LPU9_PYTIN|nr:hypothetical protein P43SY_001057 [Pythium insidiosum]